MPRGRQKSCQNSRLRHSFFVRFFFFNFFKPSPRKVLCVYPSSPFKSVLPPLSSTLINLHFTSNHILFLPISIPPGPLSLFHPLFQRISRLKSLVYRNQNACVIRASSHSPLLPRLLPGLTKTDVHGGSILPLSLLKIATSNSVSLFYWFSLIKWFPSLQGRGVCYKIGPGAFQLRQSGPVSRDESPVDNPWSLPMAHGVPCHGSILRLHLCHCRIESPKREKKCKGSNDCSQFQLTEPFSRPLAKPTLPES